MALLFAFLCCAGCCAADGIAEFENNSSDKEECVIREEKIGVSAMVGIPAYRNRYLLSLGFNVPWAAVANLDYTQKIAEENKLKWAELSFPWPFGKVADFDQSVGQKVDVIVAELNVTVHLPMAPIYIDEGFAEIMAALEYARIHGANQVVVHCADHERGWMGRRVVSNLTEAEIQEKALANLEKIILDPRYANITIGIENMAGDGVPEFAKTPEGFACLFKKDANRTVGWCLDIAHATNAGIDVMALLEKYGEYLVEVHLADTKVVNGPDKHCALGKGKANLIAILSEVKRFDVPIIIEVDKNDFVPSHKWLMENIDNI
ncbi:MAG TPA: sugar phosphate isomerase/epimerase [Candidatus Paceibacterota bacterium]|nr:sugar phosphate isomerase/epimerase [Candidatus Pacearchaeota archaeon]HRZ51510.1 sugar phosphate isomerase/epimerase [Candidatus Paceibacterota bacterium]HSA37235.1 sugar phosphate isomerase/epimerase [Candidatus Paceibacterota bacterium]